MDTKVNGTTMGIIPTEKNELILKKMDQMNLRIYRMIVERFIGLFLPAYKK